MMDVTVSHRVLAGGDLLSKADGTLQEIDVFGVGEIALDLDLKTNRGTGQEDDCLVFSLQGFHMTEDCILGALDVSVSTRLSNGFKLTMVGVEPGSSNPPAKLFMQSNRDLTGTDLDATVLVTRGAVVESA